MARPTTRPPRTESADGAPATGNFAAVLALVASLTAAGLAYAHLFVDGFALDAIGLSLVVAIFLPWLLPFVKSLKFGGAEVELRDLRRQVQEARRIATTAGEIAEDTLEAVSEPEAEATARRAQVPENERRILDAMSMSDFAFRTVAGIAAEVGMSVQSVRELLEGLEQRGLVRRARSRRRDDLWAPVRTPPP